MAAAAPVGEDRADAVAPRPWVWAAIGAIAGFASGLLGVGGGFVIVPLQVVWARTPARRASGTSLAAILPIAVVGAAHYYFGASSPQVDLRVAVLLVLGSAPGAYLGARAVSRVPTRALQGILAVALVGVGVHEIAAVLVPGLATRTGQTAHLGLLASALVTGAAGLIGATGSLVGVGGGILLVPTMVLGLGLGQHMAQGTSLLAILPTAAVGATVHRRHGNVDLRAAAWIGGVGAPASVLGASLALALPQPALLFVFGCFLLVAAGRMWPGRAVGRLDRPGVSAGCRQRCGRVLRAFRRPAAESR